MAAGPAGDGAGGFVGPRSAPRILDAALRLYLRRFGPMYALSLAAGVVGWLVLLSGRPLALPVPSPGVPSGFGGVVAGLAGVAVSVPWWASLLAVAVSYLALSSLTVLADQATIRPSEPPLPFPSAVRAGLLRLWPLLVVTLAMALGGGVGIVLLIVPGLFVLVRWSVAPAVAVLEGRRASAALGRSNALARGLFWHVIGVFLFGFVAVFVVSTVFDLALVAPLPEALRALLVRVLNAATTPYWACLLVTLYHDLRMRKEGLDLVPPDQPAWPAG